MNNNFLIENSEIELVQDLCQYIAEPNIRNKAVANALGAKLATKYFQEYGVDVDTGLHNIAKVLTDIEISDVYVNNAYIDIRLFFNENELYVPKIHFDLNILPVAYMFIKLEEDLSSGDVVGFVFPNQIDTSSEYNNYYKVSEENIVSFYDIEPFLASEQFDDVPYNFETIIFDYLDNKELDKENFFKTLLNNKEYREIFINAAKVQNIFNYVSLSTSNEENLIENADDDNEFSLDVNDEINNDLLEEKTSNEDFNLNDSNADLELNEDVATLEEYVAEDLDNLGMVEEEYLLQESDDVDADFSQEDGKNEEEALSSEEFNIIVENQDEIEEIVQTDNEDEISNISDLTNTSEVIDDEEMKISNEFAIEEDNDVQYSTETTPSLNSIDEIEEDFNEQDLIKDEEEIFNEILDNSEENNDKTIEEVSNEEIENKNEILGENTENTEEIDELFKQEQIDDYSDIENSKKENKFNLIHMVGALTIIAAIGYFGYNKFTQQNAPVANVAVPKQSISKPVKTEIELKQQAMPNESIENKVQQNVSEEGNAVSIPAIENNLDTSVLVTNLSVNWEVPSSLVNNNIAKRYFVKIGKIIQLNLKTELLLLNKPPITNKIAVELEFNKNTQKFNIKQMTISSGEKTVDDLIIQTIRKTLDMSLSSNMNTFNNVQGNPILVIRL